MTTANDLCLEGLKKGGIVALGQSANGADLLRAFGLLNGIIAQWQRRRWLIWHLVETVKVSTGANSYSVGIAGSGADIIVASGNSRPDRIEFAFFRQVVPAQPNAIDYPLEEIKSWEDWATVALKTLASFPSYFFYDSAFPVARLYVWPVMQAALYEVHILTKEALGQFPTLTTTVNLPPEYIPAIEWNLARRVRAAYRRTMDPEINALARDGTNVIRLANVQIPRLQIPPDLVRPGIYNVFSDQIR